MYWNVQYHRIYSPITFGKKYDPEGKYIRHFLPVLKGKIKIPRVTPSNDAQVQKFQEAYASDPFSDMPKQYIYEPWTAPIEVQRKAGCIIGKNYPKPGMPMPFSLAGGVMIVY